LYNGVVTQLNQLHHPKSHWHFLFHRRRSSLAKTTREIFGGQLISLTGSIVAGLSLELVKSTLAGTVGIFLILPGVFDLGGSVAGAFGAKINHALTSDGRLKRHDFGRSWLYSLGIVGLASLVLGLIGATLAALLFDGDFTKILFIAVVAPIITATIGLPIIGGLTILAARRGLDADNVIGPIETSVFDSLTILVIFLLLVVLR
jgi:cation transporter-like permease